MNVRDRGILSRPFRHLIQVVKRAENAQRTDAHQRAVRLIFGIEAAAQAAGDGVTAIKGFGIQPGDVSAPDRFTIVASQFRQRPRQHQRHLRVVGRLPRDRVPRAAIRQLAQAIGITPANLLRRLELDQAAQGIAGQLSQHAALGALQHARRMSRICCHRMIALE